MIPTLKQYADADHRRMVAEYGVALAEARRLYPVESYRQRWWDDVLASFERGADFSPQAVARLDERQLRDLARTKRGLNGGLPMNYLLRGGELARAREAS